MYSAGPGNGGYKVSRRTWSPHGQFSKIIGSVFSGTEESPTNWKGTTTLKVLLLLRKSIEKKTPLCHYVHFATLANLGASAL